MSTQAKQDAEIKRLKEVIESAHFALLTCKAHCVGKTTLQQFNAEKIRKAIALTEEIAVESAVENLDNLISKRQQRVQPLTPSLAL